MTPTLTATPQNSREISSSAAQQVGKPQKYRRTRKQDKQVNQKLSHSLD
jgi:hypothetical protein